MTFGYWSVPVSLYWKSQVETPPQKIFLSDCWLICWFYRSPISQICRIRSSSFVKLVLLRIIWGSSGRVFLNSPSDENKLPFKLSQNCTVLSQYCCPVMACLAKVSRDLKTLGMRCSCGMNPDSRVRLTQSSHLQQDSRGHHWANARNLLICLCLTKPIIFLIVLLFIIILYLSLFLDIPGGYYSAVDICLPASLSPF